VELMPEGADAMDVRYNVIQWVHRSTRGWSYGASVTDPRTGEMKWEYKLPTATLAGVMSTASGLVFAGDNDGNFNAFDAKSGKRLWTYRTGSMIWGGAAMSYMLDGKQYVLIPSGNTVIAFGLLER